MRVDFVCIPLQFSQVVEGIRLTQLACVDQAHVQITDTSTVLCLEKQSVLAMKDGLLERSLGILSTTSP